MKHLNQANEARVRRNKNQKSLAIAGQEAKSLWGTTKSTMAQDRPSREGLPVWDTFLGNQWRIAGWRGEGGKCRVQLAKKMARVSS